MRRLVVMLDFAFRLENSFEHTSPSSGLKFALSTSQEAIGA
jgi:hypothetical protein